MIEFDTSIFGLNFFSFVFFVFFRAFSLMFCPAQVVITFVVAVVIVDPCSVRTAFRG